MASKIGVYFDVQNIGGGLDVEALAEQVRSKWSDLTPVVKVLPMLSVAEDEVRADIEANGLDGVLFCGASPRDEAAPWQLPVQVEHVNLREQCVLAYKNPDGSAVSGAAPALLTPDGHRLHEHGRGQTAEEQHARICGHRRHQAHPGHRWRLDRPHRRPGSRQDRL